MRNATAKSQPFKPRRDGMISRTLGLALFAVLLTLLAPRGALSQDARPSSEGIAVHGHWTITVVRDGSVVDRREFENRLTEGGQHHLAGVLARQDTPGPWFILVEADGTGTLCADNEFVLGTDTDCAISESIGETVVSEGEGTPTVLLEGTETVVRDANLTAVHTFQNRCGPNIAAVDCVGSGQPHQFTTKTPLDTPVAVQDGDTIEVTVEISFGTITS